jgi:uncharacterized protein YjbJ (UPF0337 family)
VERGATGRGRPPDRGERWGRALGHSGSSSRDRRAEVSTIDRGNDHVHHPNKDQVKGELKDIGGKIQEEAGKLIGSKEQQVKGLQKQAEGKLQKGVGDVKEALKKG